MEVVMLTAVVFLGNKIIEALKYLRAKDWNAFVTLVSVHVVGALVMLYASAAEITEGIVVPGTGAAIGSFDGPSVIFIGLTLSALTSKLYDFQKAVDNKDSANQPALTNLDSGTE